MYEQYYGFTGRPFQLTPDHRFFFESSVHKKAASYLLYGLSQGEGFIVITGEVGAGKTTLLRHLLSTVDPGQYVSAQIVTSQLGADALLDMVADAFRLAPARRDKAGLLTAIEAFLADRHRAGRRCLLVVDEAQTLSVPALEELRMLSNLQVGTHSPLQSFLIGQPQFRRTLASRDLEQLRQRVIASYHLGPMDAAETGDYVRHRLGLVGWSGDPDFPKEALAAVYRHTEGVPRRINTLASRLLLFGMLDETHRFTGPMVDMVAAELRAETEGAGPASETEPGPGTDLGSLAADAAILRRLDAVEGVCGRLDRVIRHLVRLLDADPPCRPGDGPSDWPRDWAEGRR